MVVRDISLSTFKLKTGILPPLTNKYSKLNITYRIKPKCLVWTKLLENVLLGKYILPVPVALTISLICFNNFNKADTKKHEEILA